VDSTIIVTWTSSYDETDSSNRIIQAKRISIGENELTASIFNVNDINENVELPNHEVSGTNVNVTTSKVIIICFLVGVPLIIFTIITLICTKRSNDVQIAPSEQYDEEVRLKEEKEKVAKVDTAERSEKAANQEANKRGSAIVNERGASS